MGAVRFHTCMHTLILMSGTMHTEKPLDLIIAVIELLRVSLPTTKSCW